MQNIHNLYGRNVTTLVVGITISLIPLLDRQLLAQTGLMRANRVWCGIVENGGTGNFDYEGGWFPADYNTMGPSLADGSSMTGSSIIMATTSWTDPDDVLIPKAVIRPVDVYPNWSVDVPLTNRIRWGLPRSTVNSENITMANWAEVEPESLIGTSAQTAEVTTTNSFGVEIKRKIFAWSQQFHDNYIVVDVELTNNSGSTLDSFYVSINEGPIYWRKAKGSQDQPSIPEQEVVERDMTWHHYYGARSGDSLRIFYMYHADDPDQPGDQMGGPVTSQDGRLIESDFAYYTILHASATPYTDPANDVDDFLQPRVTDVYNEAIMGVEAAWAGTNGLGRDGIYDLMAGANYDNPPMTDQLPGTFHRANNDEQGDPDYTVLGDGFSKSSVGHSSISAFGPYTFGPDEKLHFVYASGYTGLGIEKEKEIGEQWLNNSLVDAPNLPDPVTGYFPTNFAFASDASDFDKIKDRWISTGIDSVHQAASRAKWNFEHNWQIPGSPPPPEQEITGFGDGVEIKWSDPDAEAINGFAGYRILRRVGRQDTIFFDIVQTTDASDLSSEHTWKDSSILFGASYFYYVQAGYNIDASDQNAHPDSRGKTIWSSRIWVPTTVDVQPPRQPGTDLDEIRIVPNPYNTRDPLIADYGWDDNRGLIFFNLPSEVTIKIFAENGDLVQTIEHNPPSKAGSLTWDMLSSSQQAIASGVYIAVFQRPDGELAYQKFIVVR
ncbi:hypothetical protein ACFL6E_05770 [Candidatus Neomarinimicrobiota bacterium]